MRLFRLQRHQRVPLFIFVLFVAAIGVYVLRNIPWRTQEWKEWPAYEADQPETAQLQPTGRDLRWDPPVLNNDFRLFVSNQPEGIGRPVDDPKTGKPAPWPPRDMEGKLWSEEGTTGDEPVAYHAYISHQNWYQQPMYIGLVVENLSPDVSLTIAGGVKATVVDPVNDEQENWHRLCSIGLKNAYRELKSTNFTPLDETTIPCGTGEKKVLVWKLNPGASLGARVHLVARATEWRGKTHFRISTAWAWQESRLAEGLKLIPLNGPDARGSWPFSGVTLSNANDVFDLGQDDGGGKAIRCLRLCQPIYKDGKKVGYPPDVACTKERSHNPKQSNPNNSMYGMRNELKLHVKNSSKLPQTVEIYFRYPDTGQEGSYIGAATTYNYSPEEQRWKERDTRAIKLGHMTFTDRTGREIHEWWWVSKMVASYQLQPGETKIIPLTVIHDFPATLPLGVLLKKG